MSIVGVPKLKVGDKVRIPKYSSLFGEQDAVVDAHMRHAVFEVTEVREAFCGSDDEGWFDDISLRDTLTGQPFPYMLTNASVELV